MSEIITREELFRNGLKKCSCCRDILSLSNFGKRSNRSDGLLGYCKKCAKQKRDKYYENEDNKQKSRDRSQRYRDKNRQEINEKRRQQYQDEEDVRKKNADRCKKYRESHKEEMSQYQKAYRLSRLNFFLSYSRQYYQDHQDYFFINGAKVKMVDCLVFGHMKKEDVYFKMRKEILQPKRWQIY